MKTNSSNNETLSQTIDRCNVCGGHAVRLIYRPHNQEIAPLSKEYDFLNEDSYQISCQYCNYNLTIFGSLEDAISRWNKQEVPVGLSEASTTMSIMVQKMSPEEFTIVGDAKHCPDEWLSKGLDRHVITYQSGREESYYTSDVLHPPTSDDGVRQHIKYADGTIVYTDEIGRRHSVDQPAILRPDGTVEYWVHGKLHNENGPAIIYANGTKVWYKHGKRHRAFGPAVEREDGGVEVWLDGEFLWANYPKLEAKSL